MMDVRQEMVGRLPDEEIWLSSVRFTFWEQQSSLGAADDTAFAPACLTANASGELLVREGKIVDFF